MNRMPDDISLTVQNWPEAARSRFAVIRESVHHMANQAEVGPIAETLKWGQPAWSPARPRIGTTLRCNWARATPDRLSLYVHCQTTLLERMKSDHPSAFTYAGNRAMHMDLDTPPPAEAIEHCAFLTLTYHRKTA
ncbi:hypothetical protein [Roseobacter sp.]|uniref:hypothetical protein n=1 Tax=Roseobacter sp. TaxID=1907202 RepID=UPI0038580384